MRKLFQTLALALAIATPANAAETNGLHSLVTGDDGRGWEAVGRLNMGTHSFCTGAMISETLVLTAGHCLYDQQTGARIDATEIEFLAGWRGGRASAYRGVRRAIVHPEYKYSSADPQGRIRYDLAVLELDRPIRSGSIKPFDTQMQPRKGAQIGVVSYAFDRAESPSLQESCKVLARQSGTLVMSCSVDFGSSGAPVFVIEDGQAHIVSVVSAKAMANDTPVSLGTSLDGSLAPMLAMLAQNDGVFARATPAVNSFVPTGAPSGGGAKFLRP